MKPGILEWATNDDWAGGPDSGDPTKTPPSSGQVGEGYYGEYKVAPQIWNYMRWGFANKIQEIEGMRVRNLVKGDLAGNMTSNIPNIEACCYDPYYDHFWAFGPDTGSSAMWAILSTDAGYNADGKVMTGATVAVPMDAYADSEGNKAMVCNASDDVYYNSNGGYSWTLWTGIGATGLTFTHIAHNRLPDGSGGLWVLSRNNGDLYSSINPSTAFTLRDTQLTSVTKRILHSRHPAGFLYPDDAGNSIWMAIGTTQSITSTDGVTWNAPVSHGATSPTDLAYSKYGSRWIMATSNDSSGYIDIAISDDNGVTWTVHDDKVKQRKSVGAISDARIDCDGYGAWMLAINDGSGNSEWFCSIDNGDTWNTVYNDLIPTPSTTQVLPIIFGENSGAFVSFEKINDTSGLVYHTLATIPNL